MWSWVRTVVLWSALLLSKVSFAQTSVQERLDLLNGEIATTTAAVQSAKERQRQLEKQLSELRVSLASVKSQRVSLTARVAELDRQMGELTKQVQHINERLQSLRAIAHSRIRALYREQQGGGAITLLRGTTRGSLPRFFLYAERMHEFDLRLRERFKREEEDLERQHTAVLKNRSDSESARAQLALSEKSLVEQGESQKKLLQTLAQERSVLETTLVELRAQVLRLETVLLSLTGGSEGEPLTPTAPQSEPAAGAVGLRAFEGEGLFARGARLILPVRGKLVRGYGKYKPSSLRDVVMNKGLEYNVAVGESVRAIAAGRVLFSGRMPVYGLVVVLDHGSRSYSLYGRLAEAQHGAGVDLQQGDPIATVGPLEEGEKGNFYFEIRRAGQSVNPSKLFGRLE